MKTLKNIKIIALATIAGIIVSCTYKPKQETEQVAETPAVQMQAIIKANQDSLEKIFTEALSEIDKNLEKIYEKSGKIALETGERGVSQKEKILKNIDDLNSLIAESNNKIAQLNQQVKNYRFQNKKLEKLTQQFTEKLAEHEKNIAALRDDINSKDLEIAEMNRNLSTTQKECVVNKNMAEQFEKELDKKTKDLNTAYYAKGSKNQLADDGIIAKKGGVIGLGKTATVKDDAAETYFTKIDIRETKTIPVYAKKAKLVSTHKPDSYEFVKEGETVAALEIKNPEEFWKQSKFMVLEVKE